MVEALTINLTKGLKTIIDKEDFEKISKHKWCASKGGKTYYAVTRMQVNGVYKIIPMHRFLMDTYSVDVLIDHKDRNGLNNCKNNLRLVNKSQNAMNSCSKGGTSNYLGVSYDKVNKKWRVVIKKDYKQFQVGRFETEEIAARAYDEKAIEMFGEFANLNFK